jgi:hypothetical protein
MHTVLKQEYAVQWTELGVQKEFISFATDFLYHVCENIGSAKIHTMHRIIDASYNQWQRFLTWML